MEGKMANLRIFDNLASELIRQGKLTESQLSECTRIMKNSNRSLQEVLIKNFKLSEKEIYEVIAKGLNVEYVDADEYFDKIDDYTLEAIPEELALVNNIMPIIRQGIKVKVLTGDPSNDELKAKLESSTGLSVTFVLGKEKSIHNLVWYYYKDKQAKAKLDDLASQVVREVGNDSSNAEVRTNTNVLTAAASNADSNPTVKLLNSIFEIASYKHASDIHITPYEDKAQICLRVDGLLTLLTEIPVRACSEIVARIKIFCDLKTDEKRKGQDGVLRYKGIGNTELEMRVSILPVLYGESVVMRVVDKNGLQYDLDTLGLLDKDKQNFVEFIGNPYGLLLVTGPTGSGKTTTLYTALKKVIEERPNTNIITVEDPVEQQLAGIKQLKLNSSIGFGFDEALRGILRHDPDILLIGEIRDKETADIAIRAASTGHLVLSTLHTNDAVSAVYRMVDLGVEPFMLSSVLVGTMAQRLVRKVCPHCMAEREITSTEAETLGIDKGTTVKFGKGCALCSQTGYSGRTAVYETVKVDEELRKGIIAKSDVDTLTDIAERQGMRSLKTNCRDLVLEGTTSPQEAIRVIFSKD